MEESDWDHIPHEMHEPGHRFWVCHCFGAELWHVAAPSISGSVTMAVGITHKPSFTQGLTQEVFQPLRSWGGGGYSSS